MDVVPLQVIGMVPFTHSEYRGLCRSQHIRLDSELKARFESLCEEFGMSTDTAFNIFVHQAVFSRSIPSAVEVPAKDDIMAKGRAAFHRMHRTATESGMQDMTLDDQ